MVNFTAAGAAAGNAYKLRADSHTKAVEWCRSLDSASRINSTDQVFIFYL